MRAEEIREAAETAERLFDDYESGLDDRMVVEPIVMEAALLAADLLDKLESELWEAWRGGFEDCATYHRIEGAEAFRLAFDEWWQESDLAALIRDGGTE